MVSSSANPLEFAAPGPRCLASWSVSLRGAFGKLETCRHEELRWVPLEAAGGFSGARIWRGEANGLPLFALKAWPRNATAERLTAIHRWMERAAHLRFVPAVQRTDAGSTFAVDEGRVWDLTSWMPGTADFHANPSEARLANACTALAELHRTWKPAVPEKQSSPAILRRLHALADWNAHRSAFTAIREPLLLRAVEVVARLAERAERALLRELPIPVAVQPCLCDVWHDHVLFTGNAVTGLVDYGAMKLDHVAVDLARMLGDFVGEDDARFERGLAAYGEAGGEREVPGEFVRMLDRTGIVCGIVGWLLRLHVEARLFPDPRAVALRLERLVSRGESIRHF